MFDEQIIAQIARVLTLMTALPHPRDHPLQHDLKGNFDIWFNGGAVKHDTGISTYAFTDGIIATTGTSLRLGVEITLPTGRRISVTEAR